VLTVANGSTICDFPSYVLAPASFGWGLLLFEDFEEDCLRKKSQKITGHAAK
jgi:hypothetical protein